MSSETHERFEEANERDALDGTREDGMGTDGEVSSEFRVKPGAAGEMPEFESDLFDLEMLSPPISSASTKDTDESTASKLLEEAILPAHRGGRRRGGGGCMATRERPRWRVHGHSGEAAAVEGAESNS